MVARTHVVALAIVSLATVTAAAALPTSGDPAQGMVIFSMSCGCHTLAAAGLTGVRGPNLDVRRPSFDKVQNQVTTGSGGMPSFRDALNETQIADIAAFVSSAVGNTPSSSPPAPSDVPPVQGSPAEPAPATTGGALPTTVTVTFGKQTVISEATLAAGPVTLTLANTTPRPLRIRITVRPGVVVTQQLAPRSLRKVILTLVGGKRQIRIGGRSVGHLKVVRPASA
jgi:cytochrome c6